MARMLFLLALVASTLVALAQAPVPGAGPFAVAALHAGPVAAQAERTVFLVGDVSDENRIAIMSAIAGCEHPGVVLFDNPTQSDHVKAFLEAFRPERVVPVGAFAAGLGEVEQRLEFTAAAALTMQRSRPMQLWNALFHRPPRVVVCPAEPRRVLMQAACLAGAVQAPLWVWHGELHEQEKLARVLCEWGTQDVLAIGAAAHRCRHLPDVHVARFADEKAVAAAYLSQQFQRGPIETLVVANPADVKEEAGQMSALAPWIALQRRAALLLTRDDGEDARAIIDAALTHPRLRRADNLILVADLKAIPPEKRPNPLDGKDTHIEMEPFTPLARQPFTFATGRLFHEDPGVVALMLARQRLLRTAPRKALVAGNPAGGLPLLEAVSRNTSKELQNCGYETTTMFGGEVSKDELRRLLPDHDIFLWEGHHNTLIKDYAFPEWSEPMQPALVFLQSCLALHEWKAEPLLRRGAVGVVGSSTRTYSASGAAFSLAFFDSLLYEHHSLGGALRQAKNFLLAYSLLKEKRLGGDAKKTGANLRSAWAFTLWGDPTLELPTAEAPNLAPVRHEVHGNTIIIRLPETAYEKVTTAKLEAQMRPNARLAGLLRKDLEEDSHRLVPFIFAEVRLPRAPDGKQPRLRTRLPDQHWVFCWDRRRRCGYLLVTPRARDQDQLRFHVEWQ
ncbi:MAG TPA: C25 family cysteine peptidase [Gemmataceae bacterium]|nr:C25 family cysteine peptidase [Gemmataceae bacterium]